MKNLSLDQLNVQSFDTVSDPVPEAYNTGSRTCGVRCTNRFSCQGTCVDADCYISYLCL